MRFETIIRILFTQFQLDKEIDQIAGHEKLKTYDQVESLMTRYCQVFSYYTKKLITTQY